MLQKSVVAGRFGLFLREWARRPLEVAAVAAVAPSSRALSRIIASEISAETGRVLEIGPGTGVFTAQMLENGVRPEDLVLVEKNPSFSAVLRDRFPSVRVLNADAAALDPELLGAAHPFGAAVSGLGLLSMGDPTVRRILGAVFRALGPGRPLYQFTYGWRCPVREPLARELALRHAKVGRTNFNLPPAAVYKITRVAERRAS